jgi:hypothetical protein
LRPRRQKACASIAIAHQLRIGTSNRPSNLRKSYRAAHGAIYLLNSPEGTGRSKTRFIFTAANAAVACFSIASAFATGSAFAVDEMDHSGACAFGILDRLQQTFLAVASPAKFRGPRVPMQSCSPYRPCRWSTADYQYLTDHVSGSGLRVS